MGGPQSFAAPGGGDMELEWLADLVAVVESGGFSRAAEVRNVTQPALSRRIRALEDWVGTPLFVRTTHKVLLTPAGEAFHPVAAEILRRAEEGRQEAVEQAQGQTGQLQFAATNALALTFFPEWLRRVEAKLPFTANIELIANHMEACERIMLQGRAQFLLGHHHPLAETVLTKKQFQSHRVGDDTLIPVAAPRETTDGSQLPEFLLPGTEDVPIPYLSYRSESGMGRIVTAVRAREPTRSFLKPTFSSHLAKLLVTMALEGRGVAWLPRSLIFEDLETGRLVRAGSSDWYIPIEIHVFRPRSRLSSAAELFWRTLVSEP